MANKVFQVGDNHKAIPGTSNQTGNRAPKFPWSNSPVGRCTRIVALCCAYRLGYDDDRMGKLHQFPPAKDLLGLFEKLMPWFPKFYNQYRAAAALRKDYDGPIEPFAAGDLENRVRYCYARPGRRGHDPQARVYGISVEHPASVEQNKLGGRGEVWVRCSVEVMRRLDLGLPITLAEAEEWGQ